MNTRIIIPTIHALKQAYRRGITPEMIQDTINYGKLIRKQGLTFYVMLKKLVPQDFTPQYQEKIKDTTVILSARGTIVTVYKNKHAFKSIRKKSTYLK